LDAALRRRLQARFGERLIAPIAQRHDETEIRIGPGDVPDVLRALHDEPDFAFVVLADDAARSPGAGVRHMEQVHAPRNARAATMIRKSRA
jgi:hypothetical protein